MQHSRERNLQLLKSQERPFSFYGKALAKEEALKQYKPPTAKDFQQAFKANPIPKSSLEVRQRKEKEKKQEKVLAVRHWGAQIDGGVHVGASGLGFWFGFGVIGSFAPQCRPYAQLCCSGEPVAPFLLPRCKPSPQTHAYFCL